MHELAVKSKLKIMPTQQVIDYYLSQQTAKTAKTYASTLKSFIAWANNQDYRTITPFQALDYDAYLKTTCSVATVQNRIATLKMFFKFAMECGLIDKNPFALIKQHKPPSNVANKFLTTTEIDRLLAALKQKGEKRFILGLLLASTGMRISEAQEISWKDFYAMPDGSVSVSVHRKGNEYQLLALRNDVWEAIKAYAGKEINNFDQSHLFSNPSGDRASVVTLRAWIKAGARKAGIKKLVSPHTLRHSFCSNALSAGADIRDVQEYLNHRSLTTTQVYMHGQNKKVGDFLKLKL